MKNNLLAIDGGGIRGIIPALMLAEIEQRTGVATAHLFDLFAGTSTGGILVAALNIPKSEKSIVPKYSANDIADLYRKRGKEIFSTNFWRKVRSLWGVVKNAKYPIEQLETVLKEYFGDTLLSELLTPVVITSYDTVSRKPFYFKSQKAMTNGMRDFFAVQAATATAAAPTYFSPYKLTESEMSMCLLDGGIFANNPSQILYNEAKTMDYHEDCFLLNLGTGSFETPYSHSQVSGWGIAGWLLPDAPILKFTMDATADATVFQMQQALGENYIRINPSLQSEITMDKADDKSMKELEKIAMESIRLNKNLIDTTVKKLLER